MPVTFCPAVPGNVSILHTLPDFSVKSHIIVRAGSDVLAGIVSAIGLCSAGGADIVDHDVLDTVGITQASGTY